ncbi:hypothetical protein [Mesorhizobium escarrei]|uniref:DUF4928 domain-containing protein n=1 Tax=Mesorhizobium escarrei TaxID=666018 RepID=A0ABN8JR58_9HYPH|nr:hypothetical protein [Mesorhizobium escarrei]CAH2399594.1 conserved hypothetical protein [Mesorhizobium escarrei]
MTIDEVGDGSVSTPTTEVTKKTATKRTRTPSKAGAEEAGKSEPKRVRTPRPFPASSFEEALTFARELYRVGSGQPVRRLTLFNDLGKAPDSGPSRMLITNSNRYGLTKGSYASEHLELTADGLKAVDEQVPVREQRRAWGKLAIQDIEPFRTLYERFVNARLPTRAVLIDALKETGVAADAAEEGVDTFVVNLRFVGLLQTLSGADRIVPVDHMLDELPASTMSELPYAAPIEQRSLVTQEHAEFDTTCFYCTPIGEAGSEQRRHSDLFLSTFVEPALQPFGLKVVRADAIEKPGMITRQIIEYLLRSRLVVADLSFHNPNVFYELALRHAARLPIVQIIRSSDRIPFDIHQMRTIPIDNTDIYSLVPKIETYRSEIGNQVRSALAADKEVDTPVSVYFPSFQVSINGEVKPAA